MQESRFEISDSGLRELREGARIYLGIFSCGLAGVI